MVIGQVQRRALLRIVSSESLFVLVEDALNTRRPMSVIRYGDGERAFIRCAKGHAPTAELQNQNWRLRYGCDGVDPARIGRDLLWAGRHASALCVSTSAAHNPSYEVASAFPGITTFDLWYPYHWQSTRRLLPLFNRRRILVGCRFNRSTRCGLIVALATSELMCCPVESHADHPRLRDMATTWRPDAVLLACGAVGKRMCVEMAAETGTVVLDVGRALMDRWASMAR